ncbi:MAG: hypothetical protein IKX23_11070 [Treponema sp.]|nr:hypothetical protein [Treponema sp.]
MKKLLFALSLSFLYLSYGFSQIKVLSPVEGNWSNMQPLVIDNSDGAEYFYSLNGDDPKTSGFAYDGPVLIDIDGEIELRIARSGKRKEEVTVKYSVNQDNAYGKSYSSFISRFYNSGILSYSGGVLSIPSELEYSFGLPPDSFIDGQNLEISLDNLLPRYIPCTFRDKDAGKYYRCIVQTIPQKQGLFTRKNLPFEIKDWNTIIIKDDNYIYKIDDEYWELPKKNKTIDRTKPHVISWQSIEYEQGNPVESYSIPPAPKIRQTLTEDETLVFSIDGDESYAMSIQAADSKDFQELYRQFSIDAFYGECLEGELEIGVFSDSVYQGTVKQKYRLNKRPPSQPVISVSNSSYYTHDDMKVTVTSEKGSVLYYAISEPYILDEDNLNSYEEVNASDIVMGSYKKASKNSIVINLKADEKGAAFYKIKAYAKTEKNVSKETEYSVVIDQYNYYYDEESSVELSNGTISAPFKSFDELLLNLNKGRYAKVKIKGKMHVSKPQNSLLSNCEFLNKENAEIIFENGANLVIKSASLVIRDCQISCNQKNGYFETNNASLFKLENSTLDIFDCIINTDFTVFSVFIDAYKSSVNVLNTIAAVVSENFITFINGVKTNVTLSNSTINAVSKTAMIVCVNGGNLNIKNNFFKVTANKGRFAEFNSVSGNFLSNKLNAEIEQKGNFIPVYTDSKSSLNENGNEHYGY